MNLSRKWLILLSCLLLQQGNKAPAQDLYHHGRSEGQPMVEWVGQIPSNEGENWSLFLFFKNLLFGPEPELIVNPVSLAKDGLSNIAILSQAEGKIVLAKEGTKTMSEAKTESGMSFPSLVAATHIPAKGTLITDSYLNKVFILSHKDKRVKEFPLDREIKQPTGVSYSEASDLIWIIETAKHSISIFNTEGKFVKRIGKRGTGEAEFNFPTHIWIDGSGTAYVVDAMNFRIQIFDKNGNWLSSFGEQGDATGTMARPKGIATDSQGNIYVVDALFHVVQIFDRQGRFLYYFGGQGRGEGLFWMPSGIYIDERDYIYVSDTFNNRIQIFRKGEVAR